MNKQELIKKMVNNYYLQSRGRNLSNITLEQYIRGIFKHSPGHYNEDDVRYALSLKRQ